LSCSPHVLGLHRTSGFSRVRILSKPKQTQVSSLELSLLYRVLPSFEQPRPCTRLLGPTALAPPLRFDPLQRFLAWDSGLKWPGLPRPTACAFRFSQPLGAFIRPIPPGLVSCQIRSWGLPSKAFLLPRSRAPSPMPLPSGRWERLLTPPESLFRRMRKRRASTGSHNGKAPEPPLDFRALLHVRVRHFMPTG
jgi:hypothetical protein